MARRLAAWQEHPGTRALLAQVITATVVLGIVAAAAISTTATPHHDPSPALAELSVTAAPGSSGHRGSPGVARSGRQPAPSPTIPLAPPPASAAGVTTPPPPVAPLGQLHEADALVALPASATPDLLKQLAALPHVEALEVVDAGNVQVQGAPAATIGVDPNTFRDFTPQVTASSDQLWQYVAGGSLASSFEMARDRTLTLGATVPVLPSGSAPTPAPGPAAPGPPAPGPVAAITRQATSILSGAAAAAAAAAAPAPPPANDWLGAFMSVGLPGVDMVVSRAQGAALNLTPNSGVIISAPKADPVALQAAIKSLVPGSSIELMRPGMPIGGAGGSFLTPAQMSTVLAAALSRVGLPYVWGATGPNSFDCSGLVGWSYAQAGIAMPRVAAQQALTGPQVPLDQLQPGDLLFWAYDPGNPTYIDHVAMYLGNGMMVVAPHTGDVVHVAKVPTDHLVGAVRVDPATAAKVGTAHFG